MKIAKIAAREIYNGRGYPTIECEVTLEDGSYVTASVPSGMMRGDFEAKTVHDTHGRFAGIGVQKAIDVIENIIAPAFIGQEPNLVSMDLEMIEMDGTQDKSKLGANAMLAVSIALLRAQASVENMELYELIGYLCEYSSVTLPFALFNMISGGMHAENNVRIQEMMVVPVGAQSFRASMEAAVLLHHHLEEIIKDELSFVGVTCEGGLTSNFKDDAHALEILMRGIEVVQKMTNHRFLIGLNVAAHQFYNRKTEKYDWKGRTVDAEEMIDLYERLSNQFPIFAIEDGLSPHDTANWTRMTGALSEKVQILGDQLFATSPLRISQGIEGGWATGAIIKPDQVGTLTETLQSVKLCKEYEMTCILSNRCGETNDTIIVDLAVAVSSGYIKAGGPCRGEHIAKYNELLRIEDLLMFTLLNS